MNDWQKLIKSLRAIAEGYDTEGRDDRFIVVRNPDFAEDNGSDPLLVIDVDAWAKVPVMEKT